MATRSPSREEKILNSRAKWSRESEVLSCRLILAYLLDDPAERELAAWTVLDPTRTSFVVSEGLHSPARSAAEFWRQADQVALARKLLQAKLDSLTA